MTRSVEIIFWISFLIMFYAYAGYPILLLLLTRIKKIFWKSITYIKEPVSWPKVTLIVAAFNEERIIEEKISNTLGLDYPENSLQILFITDGSTDQTPQIVEKYTRISLLHQPLRKGKLAAMNRAMEHTTTDLVVFSDANTLLNSSCIKKMVVHYNNARVGGVAGEKKIKQENDLMTKGEGLYWSYESALKQMDSDLCTVVGAAGELFSIRTSLYIPLPENVIIEDFVQSLQLCLKGYIVKYEKEAFSIERASGSVKDEMERKIRISAGAFQAMGIVSGLFNVFRYPVISFQFISHRILRWTLCPLALILLLTSSFILYLTTGAVFWGIIMLLQLLFWAAAGAGWMAARKNKHSKFFYLPFYFTFMHLCVFAGFRRFISKNQPVTWQKAPRGKKI